MLKNTIKSLFLALLLLSSPAYAVMPNIFATQPTGNVAASLLDQNFTFNESQGVQALTTTGSSNSYVATPSDAWATGYSSYTGRALTVIPNFTNTGASTFNVSSLGAASIYKNIAGTPTALASGDMVSGTPAILICDGTNFLLTNPTQAAGGSAGAMTLLSTQTISTNTASIIDTSHVTSSYSHYVWEISNLTSSVNNVDAYVTVQQGGVFLGGSSYVANGLSSSSTNLTNYHNTGSAQFNVTHAQGSIGAPEVGVIRFEFWNPATVGYLAVIYETAYQATYTKGAGWVNNSAATTGIKLVMSSGSIATAVAKLYGIQ